MKAVSIVLILVGLAAMGMGLASAPSSASNAQPLPKVAMRELGSVPPGSVAVEKSAPPPVKAEAAPRPNVGGNALEKALEKTQEKPNDDLAAPEKSAAKAPPPEKAAPAEKTAEKAPPPAAEKAEKTEKAEKAEKAEKPEKAATGEHASAPPPAPAKSSGSAKATADKGGTTANPYDSAGGDAAPAAAMGIFNLRASDTADVYVDGKKVGGSPLKGFKVKAGKHKVRFDCYQASGETKPGTTQSYDVAADGERDIDYECPAD